MQHINTEQIQKITGFGAQLEAHRKSGNKLLDSEHAARMQRQILNFMSCVRKSVRKFMS